jgi:hypothetical protein
MQTLQRLQAHTEAGVFGYNPWQRDAIAGEIKQRNERRSGGRGVLSGEMEY